MRKSERRGFVLPAGMVSLVLAALLLFAPAAVSAAGSGVSTAAQTAYAENEAASEILAQIPEYSGDAYTVVNDNVPSFSEADLTTVSFETYSSLDTLGRAGAAYANVGTDLMPTQERESISSVYPSGWVQAEYDFVDGGYLYNRCHLIGYQLTAENANEQNLITGTRYLNVEGMLPFENLIADFVEETGYHVLYRVTPVYDGDDLVASGVLMEALSVEDGGEGVSFCVYCYNVQPGVTIDYATGGSALNEEEAASLAAGTAAAASSSSGTSSTSSASSSSGSKTTSAGSTTSSSGSTASSSASASSSSGSTAVSAAAAADDTQETTVWIPTNGGTKYHSKSSCSNMKNPKQVTLSQALAAGYTACKKCH